MAEEQAPPAGPDLAQGIASSDFTGRDRGSAMSAIRMSCWYAPGLKIFAIEAHLQPLSRTARGGARGRPQHPLSLAPRLFRFGAPGKLRARRRLPRSPSGKSSTRAIASSSGENANNQSRA